MKAIKRTLLAVLATAMVLTLAGRSEAVVSVTSEVEAWTQPSGYNLWPGYVDPPAFSGIPQMSATDHGLSSITFVWGYNSGTGLWSRHDYGDGGAAADLTDGLWTGTGVAGTERGYDSNWHTASPYGGYPFLIDLGEEMNIGQFNTYTAAGTDIRLSHVYSLHYLPVGTALPDYTVNAAGEPVDNQYHLADLAADGWVQIASVNETDVGSGSRVMGVSIRDLATNHLAQAQYLLFVDYPENEAQTTNTYYVEWDIVEGDPPPVAEPAGLGLVGLALLALRKRRN